MIAKRLKELRIKKGLSQREVSEYMTENGCPIAQAGISKWENGQTEPSAACFLMLCKLYEVRDVISEFLGEAAEAEDTELNQLGKKRLIEYSELLKLDERFSVPKPQNKVLRQIPFFDIPVSAGVGMILDSEYAEMIEVDEAELPDRTSYALTVRGDSMMPRFSDGQMIFVRQQETLEDGEIGIFLYNGDVFCKVLEIGKTVRMLSLNAKYRPIEITGEDEFRVLGKVLK